MPMRKVEEKDMKKAIRAAGALWGVEDVNIKVIRPGVMSVDTSRHGGFLIEKQTAKTYLTTAARKRGNPVGQFLGYEEDCDAAYVLFEHPELFNKKKPTAAEKDWMLSSLDPQYLAERKIKELQR